ncbi:MAG: LapA family protein [Nitrosomonas sp.]|nr:LapA family protein [Nitrosomonas sp.]
MNSENITLYYFEDRSIEIPLSVVLLVFFALGVFLTIFTTSRCPTAER